MLDLNLLKKSLPKYLLNVADVLLANDFQAYLVGGAVRDLYLNRPTRDFDIATNALPEEIAKLYPRTVTTNARFGTVLVIMEDEHNERFDLEITTYRKEEDYVSGRWPSKVVFTSEIVIDLSRRDFTINALALNLDKVFDPSVVEEELILDPFNGRQDMNGKIIRAVGKPLDRFLEDGLRAYRACRLAAELDFTIEQVTFAAIKNTLHIAKKISVERIREEFIKLIMHSPKPSVGIDLLRQAGLLELFLPELTATIGLQQQEFHEDDVYTHSLKCLDLAEDSVKLAILLHDIGKAKTRSEDEKGVHFYGHDVVSADLAKAFMERMRFSKVQINKVWTLIRWHMFYYPSADWRKSFGLDPQKINQQGGGWTDAAIRRFIQNVGEEYIDDLFKLRIADATSNPKSLFNPVEIKVLQERISAVRAKDMAIKLKDLDINGNDLQALGITPGAIMGKILNELLDIIIDKPILNKKEELKKIASKLQKKYQDV